MPAVSSIITQLKIERDRVPKQLSGMEAALRAFAGAYGGGVSPGRRQISAAGKKRIAVAQRARWAKIRGESAKPRRSMSAASRKKIAAAQRARWAKVRKKA
jgi:hypothetical protein